MDKLRRATYDVYMNETASIEVTKKGSAWYWSAEIYIHDGSFTIDGDDIAYDSRAGAFHAAARACTMMFDCHDEDKGV